MAQDFDNFPLYDPLVKSDGISMSDLWVAFIATFTQNLTGYLSQNGVFIPNLTVADKALITTPVEGQMIYVSDANTPTLPRTAELQIWQLVAGVGQWTTIV